MIKTYYDKIKDTIQQHPEIPPCVVASVLDRCSDYLEQEYAQEDSNYICYLHNLLLEWVTRLNK